MSEIKRTKYFSNEVIFEKSVEQAIDAELALPDYCGDISSILHCFAYPNILTSSLSKEKIEIKGIVLIRLLYLSEGEIFSYESNIPFETVIHSTADAPGAMLRSMCAVQYLNCRAANSRKAEVHGSVITNVTVSACKEKSVIDTVDGEDIQLKKELMSACSASGSACVNVNVAQVVDIGANKPEMKSIVRSTAGVEIEQIKQVSSKILVKGELHIKTLYKSDKNDVEYIENTLPLSQILDIEGVTEESVVDIKSDILSLSVQPKPSALGNMTLLDISANVALKACAYSCIDFPVLKDAYSTEKECSCDYKTVEVESICCTVEKNYLHAFAINTIPSVKRVIDMWCDEVRCDARQEDCSIVFFGNVKVFVLFEEDNGNISLKQAQSEFSFSQQTDAQTRIKCEPNAFIAGCDYLLEEDEIKVRADICVKGVVFCEHSVKVIDNFQMNADKPACEHAVYIYYGEKGEQLWDIARRFKTTPAAIMNENNLEEETLLSPRALVIWR